MRQFHWKFEGHNLFTCAADMGVARKVFTDAIADWAWQDPEFFARLAKFIVDNEPFTSATEYPIVAMPEKNETR